MTNGGWGDAINSEPCNTVNEVFFKEAVKGTWESEMKGKVLSWIKN